jgi:NADH-quinone oxidoreductase subunit E
VARLTGEFLVRAQELVGLYPQKRSALIPILHVAQEQDGWLTPDAIAHAAELVGVTPAEALGTASFYDMLFTEPVGRNLVSICTNIACLIDGGYELLEHAEEKLGVKPGGTTEDGQFTLEEVECIALCGNAPCLAVNWRFFGDVTTERFDEIVSDLRTGRLDGEVPPHGTLSRVRRSVGLVAAQSSPSAAAPSAGVASDAPVDTVRSERGETEPAHEQAVDQATAEGAELQGPAGAEEDE